MKTCLNQFHNIATEIIFVYSPMGVLFYSPLRTNILDHNIIVLIGLVVRKMHFGTRVKSVFGEYGLSYQTASKCQNYDFGFLALNNCSFLNTDPSSSNEMHFVPFLAC